MAADGTCGDERGRLDEVSRNLQGIWNQPCALSFLVPTGGGFRGCGQSGIYLSQELPFWGSFDKKDERLMAFLHQEGENILREYGHHPSFRMMALGNELWGDIDKMKEFVDDFRKDCAR